MAGPARGAARGRRAPRRAHEGRRRRHGAVRGQRRALQRRAAAAGPRRSPRCIAHDPGGAAQARDHPRRARRLRPPLRAGGDRHRDPVALHARPGLGGRDRRARADDPARGRARDLRRELGALRRRGRDRARGRRPRRAAAVGGLARPEGLGRRDLHRARWRPTRTRSRPPSAATSTRCPGDALLDTFSAPYMQRALVEIVLLAVLAGVLGAWIVLRRLAFFTHSVGTADLPRPRGRLGPWGIAPQLAALGAALGFAGAARAHGARARVRGGRRHGHPARRRARARRAAGLGRLPLRRGRRPAAVRHADRAQRPRPVR